MKLNEYFSLSDLATLSVEQFEALRKYLTFIGIDFDDSYENIKYYNSRYPEDVLTVWDTFGIPTKLYITLTCPEDEDLTIRHGIDEILRMVAIGEMMNER